MVHVYLGVIVVGLIFAGKIIMESLKVLGDLKSDIHRFRTGTESCKLEIEHEVQQSVELENEVKTLQSEVNNLEEKEKVLRQEVNDLGRALDSGQSSHRFKIDL